MKRFALLAFTSLATLAGLYALYELRGAVLIVALSIALAAAAEPIIEGLANRGHDRRLALGVTYIIALAVLSVSLYLAASSIVDELPRATDGLAGLLESIHRDWPAGSSVQRFVARNMPAFTVGGALEGSRVTRLLPGAFGATKELVSVLAESVIILILSIYWNASPQSLERLWLSVLPPEVRTDARTTWDAVKESVGDQLRRKLGQTVLALIVLEAVFEALGLPYSTIPALVAAIARMLPIIGIPIAAIFAAVCGFAVSPLAAVVAGTVTGLALLLLRRVLGPRIFKARELSPLLLVVVVILLADELGVVGLLVAPLIAAATETVFAHFSAERVTPAVHGEDIEGRLAALRKDIEAEDTPPHVRSLVERLGGLVEEAKEAARAA